MASNPPSPPPILTTGSVASEVSMLFRTKRVSEIRAVESNIRSEAEDKSEALHELLGTRYKDLLRAADEIALIRDAASISVRDALQKLAKEAAALRQDLVKKGGIEVSPRMGTDDLDRRKRVQVVGGKLKHIVDSPEVLYACLEEGKVYEASVRYALAAGNYGELKVGAGVEGVASRFAERRWKQVEVFRGQILAAAENKLVTQGLESGIYAGVFASLVILGLKERDVGEMVDGMLMARTMWIEDENRGAGEVVGRIGRIARVVKDCVGCLADMFWKEEGGVEELLKRVDQSAAEEVRRLRESAKLRKPAVAWIQGVKIWLEEQAGDILAAANSSKILTEALRALDAVFGEERWEGDCRAVLGESPKYVFDIFTPLISERAAAVASESVERAVEKAVEDIVEVWGAMGVGKHAGKQIWAKIANDTVAWRKELEQGNREQIAGADSKATEETDIARTLAFHSPVSNVVGAFEASLLESLGDVAVLTERIPSVADAFGKSVRSSLPRILEKLRNHLSSIPVSFSDDVSSNGPSCDHLMEKALFVARTATAFWTAESVHSAYSFRALGVGDMVERNHSKEDEGLEQFSRTAKDIAWAGYKTWANRLCLRLQERLQKELMVDNVLTVPTGWGFPTRGHSELTNIDTGSAGALRYPTTLSTALMNFVLEACRAANHAGGFALPHEAIQFLRQEMSSAAVSSYRSAHAFYCGEDFMSNKSTAPTEKKKSDAAVMQMLFDVLVLQQLFDDMTADQTTTSPKDTLKAIEQQLHSAIDPIDLASSKKALLQSVDGYSSRSCILFGTITRNSLGRSAYLKRTSSSSSQQTASNLVSLAPTVPRFTYLPAPMPSTYSATGAGNAGLSTKAALGALRSEASAANGSAYRKREDTSVAGYASKVSESVGRFGRGFFESLTRKVG